MTGSLQSSPAEQVPGRLDPAGPMANHSIMQDKGKIAVSGDQGHKIADSQA
jgi:hypothetical protein